MRGHWGLGGLRVLRGLVYNCSSGVIHWASVEMEEIVEDCCFGGERDGGGT